ncbi:MAG: hypothetical protein HY581_01500 [Nitrospirae bacterium]|nr:hypothetical protein [Nitrospirota bacterium]
MLSRISNCAGPLLAIIGLWLAALAGGCASGPSAPAPGVFDGIWASSQLAYDVELNGPLGVASRARAGNVQDGDPVFRMISAEGTHFTARQWFSDGGWHTVTGELKPDGTLHCRSNGSTWVMERK